MEAILAQLRFNLVQAKENYEHWKALNYGQELVKRKNIVDDLEEAILLLDNHLLSRNNP